NYLNTHYRSPLTYGEENMLESQAALKRLWNTFRELQAYIRDAPAEGDDASAVISATKDRFETAMDDDFNTRAAIETLFSMSTDVNKMLASKSVSKAGAEAILAFIASVDDILGIYPEDKAGDNDAEFENAMALVIDLRKEVRAKKQYDLADMIRDRLKAVGYAIEDGKDGAKWKKESDCCDDAFSAVMELIVDLRKEVRAKKQYDLADMIRDRLKAVGYAIEDSSEGAKWKKI
ncbi:MAG: hypothetical protein MJZ38_05675, partial [archaeon]|nr:hypothetical protein [archaeon]